MKTAEYYKKQLREAIDLLIPFTSNLLHVYLEG